MIKVDNIAVMWAFQKGRCGNDPYVTFFVQAILFVCTQLHCFLTVQQYGRCSSDPATIADTLSRDDHKAADMKRHLKTFKKGDWPAAFVDWMDSPSIYPQFKHELLANFLA